MTYHRQLVATRANGTSWTVATERDDARGRATLDRMALVLITWPEITECHVTEPVDRIASTTRGHAR